MREAILSHSFEFQVTYTKDTNIGHGQLHYVGQVGDAVINDLIFENCKCSSFTQRRSYGNILAAALLQCDDETKDSFQIASRKLETTELELSCISFASFISLIHQQCS
jgi:hypothetical protein